MNKELEFEARIYQNVANSQFSLIPIKKNLSKEILELMSNSNVVGFKMTILKELHEMPKPKIKRIKKEVKK